MKPASKKWKRLGKALLITAMFMVAVWWGLPFALPLPGRLTEPVVPSLTFLASDGTPLRQLLTDDGQRVAQPSSYNDIPRPLLLATLAAEDRRFFEHHGVDFTAIARAAWDDIRAWRVVSGASTITQQLAKISADEPRPRSIYAKIIEAIQARRIEMTWDKQRIVTEYLNRVSYGNLLTGCASAAQGYFHKPMRDLTPAECAFLAALPQSPTRLNPFKNFDAVKKRQQRILTRMHELGWLDDEALNLALNEKPTLRRFTGGFEAPHAVALLGHADLRLASGPEGAQVMRTSIVSTLQSRVESIITARLALLRDRHVTQAAAVVIENSTGRVLALAGSRDFFSNDSGQINGAWMPHSAGSAVKPFTYLLALQRGFTPATVIPDLPIEFSTTTGIYRPENYDHRNYGPVTLRTALGSSLNIPAVRVLKQIGGEKVLCDALHSLGITSLIEPPEHYGLGLTIGNAPVRLLELANAYACLARLGEFKPWTLLADETVTASTSLYPASVCYLMADILHDNQARVPTFGPHSVIRLPFPCAVKTGTSRNYRDNWTLGFTPEFTVGVWAGNFDNTPMENVSGVTGAGPIFSDIFKHLQETFGTTWFEEPPNIVHARIDPRTGHRLDEKLLPPRVSREDIFISGTEPKCATEADYEADTGRAFLGPEYANWLAQGDLWATGLLSLRPESAPSGPPQIISPKDGTVLFLDPDLGNEGRRLLLQAQHGNSVRWTSPTLRIETEDGRTYAWLEPGRHLIHALSDSAELTTVAIEVKPAEDLRKSRPLRRQIATGSR